MKTPENQKSSAHQPATQKPFFGATSARPFFSPEQAATSPFFPAKAASSLPIQAKLTVGQVGDQYEQEADRVAAQVVDQINAPASATGEGQAVQRMGEEEEDLQMQRSPLAIQRVEQAEEDLQMMPIEKSMQRMGEEEDELQRSPLQRMEMEEDQLQMMPTTQQVGIGTHHPSLSNAIQMVRVKESVHYGENRDEAHASAKSALLKADKTGDITRRIFNKHKAKGHTGKCVTSFKTSDDKYLVVVTYADIGGEILTYDTAFLSPRPPGASERSAITYSPDIVIQLKLDTLQRETVEDDELQMMPIAQPVGAEGGAVSADLEGEINHARGGGLNLSPNLQTQMGQAMGADFSGVRVHTDARADQLNRAINSRAFTTKQDLFFKQGEYQPGSRSGQELIAHELTHVVQQNGSSIRRRPATSDNTTAQNQSPVDAISNQNSRQIQAARGVASIDAFKDSIFGTDGGGGITDRRSPSAYVGPALNALITPVTIPNVDGNDLEGRFYAAAPASPRAAANQNTVVLLLTGSGGSAEAQGTPIARAYSNAGVAVLSVNYRGFGQSHTTGQPLGQGGEPSEAGLYTDAEAMFGFLQAGTAPLPQAYQAGDIIVHGFSLGGPVAAHVAKYVQNSGQSIKMLVLDRAMPSVYKASRDALAGGAMGAAGGAWGIRHLGGALSKAFVGKMSISDKVEKLDTQLRILFATANDQMRAGDEAAYNAAKQRGQAVGHVHAFDPVTGADTVGHMDSVDVMPEIIAALQYAHQI
jgi:pimeloyl-ACP methyl ester carboxylesterase